MAESDKTGDGAGGIFKDPQALSPDKHADLRLKQVFDGFGFARAQHVVPVTAHEIPQMATHYPIIFVGPQSAPCAVMGVGEPVNLFVSEQGVFADDADPPSALRQYPFFLKAGSNSDQMLLCIDRAAPHFSTSEGDLLFEDGKASKTAETVMQYLGALDHQRRMTATFVEQLKKFDLLATREMKGRDPGQAGGEPRAVATYITIDEKKLNELGDKQLGELAKPGFLAVCYAILMSQHNWRQLMRLAQKRAAGKTN